ncbi:MAG: glycosyltransferase, partial [Promethearchaeota archaeon]
SPKIKENILLKQFIKSPQIVNKMVDLAIIHGGRGTVYNVAYSGKPSIGIPTFIEQQYNIDCLVRNGAGLRISRKFFKPEKLLKAINTIFDNYDKYLKNAQELSKKLSGVTGEEKAVERITEIVDKKVKK